MFPALALILVLIQQPVPTVDQGISLYEMGDIPGAIQLLETLLRGGGLPLDEELRACNRLGSAYYAMGDLGRARQAYSRLLSLDVHYDLGPRANPKLRELLAEVRENTMATAMVRSNPGGALVTLDNDLLGVTPLNLDGLVGGNVYTIRVYQVGFETETYTLSAQPGQHHELSFQLREPSVPVAGSSGGEEHGTLLAQDTETQPVETVQGTQAAEVSPGEGAGSSSTAPRTTEELIAALTQGGRGIDMSTLAGSGALQSDATQETPPIAGSSSSSTLIGLNRPDGPVVAEEGLAHVMVFGVPGSQNPEGISQQGSSSSRSGEEIMEVLSGKQEQIRFIFNKHLRTDPLLAGTVEVEMVIQPSGRVSDVTILQSNTYNPAFELELVRAISTWRFGSVDENEGPLILQFPFNFR